MVRTFLVVLGAVCFSTLASGALADSTIRTPDDHPHYVVEIEPHGLLGWDIGGYHTVGLGAGLRASIPIVRNGFIPTLNNMVAITFGADWLYFNGCYYYGNTCGGGHNFYFPVGLQWNFYVAKQWSVFGEPGAAPYYAAFDSACDTIADPKARGICQSYEPNHFSVIPFFSVGARLHFNEHVTLTMRVGYPILGVGVSFM